MIGRSLVNFVRAIRHLNKNKSEVKPAVHVHTKSQSNTFKKLSKTSLRPDHNLEKSLRQIENRQLNNEARMLLASQLVKNYKGAQTKLGNYTERMDTLLKNIATRIKSSPSNGQKDYKHFCALLKDIIFHTPQLAIQLACETLRAQESHEVSVEPAAHQKKQLTNAELFHILINKFFSKETQALITSSPTPATKKSLISSPQGWTSANSTKDSK